MADFLGTLDPAASWADIPLMTTDAVLMGGSGGPLNEHALQLAARTKYLRASFDALALSSDAAKGAALVGYSGRTLSAHLGDVIWIKDKGVTGDGATNDTSAINAAIAAAPAGSTVIFTPGKYIVDANGVVLKSGVSLIGMSATITYAAPTVGFAKFFTSGGSAVSDIEISGFTFDGLGTFSSTPFVNPYGGGNSVGFSNSQMGIGIWGGASSNIRIVGNTFKGLSRGCYLTGINGLRVIGNTFTNNGQAGVDCQDSSRFVIANNIISGVLGNLTTAGDTSLANSKFADGIYLYRVNGAAIAANHIDNIIRIGVVLEGDAITKNSGVAITGNVFRNLNSCRGTEYNAAIWSEGLKSDYTCTASGNICDNTGAVAGALPAIGIMATYMTVTGNTVRGFGGIGISGKEFKAFNNTIESNGSGVSVTSQGAGTATEIIGNRIANNTLQGIELYQSRGAISIRNNTIQDNGSGATLNRRAGIIVNRFYNNQFLSIASNTFHSAANQSDTAGQLYGVIGIAGGDVAHSSRGIFNNQFFFSGTFTSAYPVNLGISPCSYAYDNTSGTIFTYEIGPDNDQGNINSKYMISGAINHYTGTPVFVGYAAAAPATGTYRKGDYMMNSSVAAAGYMGWICTTAGTPGTWKGFGAIQA